MYLNSVGGNYLKAKMQNNHTKVRCELYKREITKKHVHSLAAINKSIREMQEFLTDIQANSGYCKDVQEFSPLYQSNVLRAASKTAQKDVEIADLKKARIGRRSRENIPSALSRQFFKSEISDLDQRKKMVTQTEFGVDQVDEGLQLRDEKTEQDLASETGCSSPAKNAIRTGKVSGHERDRRSYEMKEDRRNTKEAQWFVRDENLIETDRRNSSSINKNLESDANELHSDFKESQARQKETKTQRSRSFLQSRKNVSSGEEDTNVQNAETQLLTYKAVDQPSEPWHAWTDRPLKKRDSPIGLSKAADVTAVSRSQTAPAKTSRLKSQVKLDSVSERKCDFTERLSTAKSLSSIELKKLKIHVSLSKTERMRILQELICNSTVTPDRSFLEREKEILLKDKINKFFESLSEQADTKQGNDEEDILRDDEDPSTNKGGY